MQPGISFGILDMGESRRPMLASAEPLRILLMGDFSGAESRDDAAGAMRPVAVDRDDFDDRMAQLSPTLRIDLPGGVLELAFSELDDFHPDRLFDRAPIFEQLRALRRRLQNPSQFAAAAAEIAGWGQAAEAAPTGEPDGSAPEGAPPIDASDLLQSALDATPSPGAAGPSGRANSLVDALVRSVVAPHVIPRPDPRLDEMLATVDAAIADGMRAILHHPAFQRLEAAWRALYLLVRRLDTGSQLKLYVLDVGREALATDLMEATDLQRTAFFKTVIEPSVGVEGGDRWGLFVGLFGFGQGAADAALLGRVGRLATLAGAPFAATAQPSLFGAGDLGVTSDPDDWAVPGEPADREAWTALRLLPEANYLALLAPRILLRQPYGRNSDPCETVVFEEIEGVPQHECFLWGEAGLAAAYAVGMAYAEVGWGFRIEAQTEIDGLPFFVADTDDGDREPIPCAEVLLTERAAARLRVNGVTPVVSVRHQDKVRLGGLMSIGEAGKPLAGGWASS